jgi:neutral ceramidase
MKQSRIAGTLMACLSALASVLLPVARAADATEAPVGMVEEPCPPPLPLPAEAARLLDALFMQPRTLTGADFAALGRNAAFSAWESEQRRRGARDWAGLCRHHAANETAARARTGVVFIGDSITENWLMADPAFFSGGVVNRGIGAQTSAQMLLRFRSDVVRLRPRAVHILAGTNDVAGNNGPTSPAAFQGNIESMVELARAHGIRVILGSIPPAAVFSWRPALRPAPRIVALNAWLRDYARRNDLTYVDYHAALAGPAGELRAELGNDGVHPNRDGYVLMRRLAAQAIDALPAVPEIAAVAAIPAAASRSAVSRAPAPPVLRAGAARVDYTPSAAALPAGFRGILDPIHVRALVVDNGRSRAALVTIDAGAIPTELYAKVSARAAAELAIPAEQLLLSATHTHSVPFRIDPSVEDKVLQALRESVARLEPARIAWGTGRAYINVNRDRIDPVTNRWWEGPNVDGPSDKTVAVLRVETPAGKPIAVYSNYAVHAVITGTLDLVSGDIPGAVSRYVEESLGEDVVALWTSGAAGDQNPIYFNQTYELRDLRIAAYARRGEDISNAMPPGGQGMDRDDPRVARLMREQQQMVQTLGQMLGEEVLHVMRESLERAPDGPAVIRGAQSRFTCPARRRTDRGRAGYPGTYVDDGEVPIRLAALRIGDAYIGAVDGEVYSTIGHRLKRESPFKHTLLSTLTNGMAPTGYIPSEDAFGRNVFTVLSSRLKPGCAEAGIVGGLLDLMRGL